MDDLRLGSEFPAATREGWLRLVEGVLKGAGYEKLVAKTYDGLQIEPLYPRAEAGPTVARSRPGPWGVMQRVDHPDPETANELALTDLEGGADGLALVLAGARSARGFGLPSDPKSLDAALAGIRLDWIHLRIEAAPFEAARVAALILALFRQRGLEPSASQLDLGLDPLGDAARTGRILADWPAASDLAETMKRLNAEGFGGRLLRVDTRPYHEAGASEGQELAAALAAGVAYLRALEAGGFPLDAARSALSFLLVADADEFLTVAKLRALRQLWSRVEEACGLSPNPIVLQAETAWRMTSRRDPWVNLLRATMAVFSAGIGGADSVTALPFTAALGLPDAFARRLARNTQLILLEEANLWRVADPAAGAGGFEALTDALAEQAWGLFQEIEREGGLPASLGAGAFQGRIAVTRAERDRSLARRKDALTGVSEFPDLREGDVGVLLPLPATADGAEEPLALPSRRAAEPFERLRDASDAVLARTGARPKVFLANLGPIAAFTARATFAKNLFEAGGIEAVSNDGFGSHEALAEAFRASGATLSCLCSSDEIYATQAATAAEALKAAGVRRLYLAGRPGPLQEPLDRAGVDEYVFAGCDALKTLEAAHGAVRA